MIVAHNSINNINSISMDLCQWEFDMAMVAADIHVIGTCMVQHRTQFPTQDSAMPRVCYTCLDTMQIMHINHWTSLSNWLLKGINTIAREAGLSQIFADLFIAILHRKERTAWCTGKHFKKCGKSTKCDHSPIMLNKSGHVQH